VVNNGNMDRASFYWFVITFEVRVNCICYVSRTSCYCSFLVLVLLNLPTFAVLLSQLRTTK